MTMDQPVASADGYEPASQDYGWLWIWQQDLCRWPARLDITINNLKFAMRLWDYGGLCTAPYLTQVLLMHYVIGFYEVSRRGGELLTKIFSSWVCCCTHGFEAVAFQEGSRTSPASYFSNTFCCMSHEGEVYIALQSFTSTSSKY